MTEGQWWEMVRRFERRERMKDLAVYSAIALAFTAIGYFIRAG